MTATPPDPHATQHDSTTDHDDQAPVDAQTLRLREENRALRDLLAAQVHAQLPPPAPGCLKRIGWWLISAPGAALVGWRSLLGRDDAPRITGRRVGSATLTVLYTLAIYGALVLLVVSWNAPNNGITGATSASPVRVPLMPPAAPPVGEAPSDWEADALAPAAGRPAPEAGGASPGVTPGASADAPTAPASGQADAAPGNTAPDSSSAARQSTQNPQASGGPSAPSAPSPAPTSSAPPSAPSEAPSAAPASGPHSTLRITEIPAQDPLAWVKTLQTELDRCATLGFFERPDCAWAARDKFCEPNKGWGVVNECPARP